MLVVSGGGAVGYCRPNQSRSDRWSPAMPFYRLNEEDFRPGDDFDPVGVPRAVAAFGGHMVTKGFDLALHEHRKAELLLTLSGVVR
jgi:hypothetical protein